MRKRVARLSAYHEPRAHECFLDQTQWVDVYMNAHQGTRTRNGGSSSSLGVSRDEQPANGAEVLVFSMTRGESALDAQPLSEEPRERAIKQTPTFDHGHGIRRRTEGSHEQTHIRVAKRGGEEQRARGAEEQHEEEWPSSRDAAFRVDTRRLDRDEAIHG